MANHCIQPQICVNRNHLLFATHSQMIYSIQNRLFQAKLHAYFDFIHIENTVKLLKSSFVCYAIVPASRFNRKMPESGAFSRIS